MFIIKDKISEEYFFVVYKSQLAELVGCSIKTIKRHENDNNWMFKNFLIIKPRLALIKKSNAK